MTLKRKLMLAAAGVLALAGAGTAIAATTGGHTAPKTVRGAGISPRVAFGLPGPGFARPRGFGRLGFGRPGARGLRFGTPAGRGLGFGTPAGRGLGFGTPAGRGLGFGRPGAGGDDLAAAASYLGTTPADLLAQLGSGKTLAQVANATSGKSAAGLIAALVAHEKQELAAAVSARRLTQAQADAMSAELQQRITDLVNGVHPAGPGRGFGHRGPGQLLPTAASSLGTTPASLLTQLQAGKTLAQVANATCAKSAPWRSAALLSHEKQELAAAVSAGRLTQAQADAMSAELQQRITDLVNGVHPAGPGRGFGHRGPGQLLPTAASSLGTTPASLLTQLQAGKTLAQVANATCAKSAPWRSAALLSHEKQELAAAVSAGRLTQAQADAMSAELQQRIT